LPSCTLEIGGRLVARADGGPFEAEYALFEAHEIELHSTEPGTVREHGYATTVELARERLEAAGATVALAEAVAEEMGSLVTAYARGAEVRRVASLLGAAELFEGRTWNPQGKRYEGAWLELGALAADLGVENGARALQALHLAAVLRDAAPDARVYLTTSEYTASRRPGERTHKRAALAAVAQLPDAIRTLAEQKVDRSLRDAGPARSELLSWVRERKPEVAVEASKKRLEALEKLLSVRDRPARGPLSDPELWTIEVQLADGDSAGVSEKLDGLERSRGRQPGTTYLRARLNLMLGTEDPRAIAERASSLALSMSAFPELELLAAEAWSRAGEKKRALAYARDLADNPQVDVGIRARARALVEPVGSPSGERPASAPPGPRKPTSSVPDGGGPVVAITAGFRSSIPPLKVPSFAPVAASAPDDTARSPTQSEIEADELAPDTPIEPVPIVHVRGSEIPAPPAPEPEPPPAHHQMAEQSETRPMVVLPAFEGRALSPVPQPIPLSPLPPAPAVIISSPPPPPPRRDSSQEDDEDGPPAFVKGGSLPPFRSEPPPANFPPAPLVPNLHPERVERAEALSLPPGLHGESVDTLPANPWEARIYFTQLSRELGRLYRTKMGVELRIDVRSVEIVQRHLAERFERGLLETPEDEREVHLHGAFLSELLARRMGAEWVDLGPSEVGYWAMNVPPGTRVWPIGRVIRYVSMQHRERDLVSYVLELQARASGLR
jgi:hypothetical protein